MKPPQRGHLQPDRASANRGGQGANGEGEMKFRKPQWSGETAGRFYFDACMKLISDLPDEFEIVPEGHVCVKWPKDLTADYLKELADGVGRGAPRIGTSAALINLAAIAPEKKKRMFDLYRAIGGRLIAWDCSREVSDGSWRKVAGPIEIED